MSDTTWYELPSVATVGEAGKPYGAVVHGDTAQGEIDVEFPDLFSAVAFGRVWSRAWRIDLRDCVGSLCEPVVMVIRGSQPWAREFESLCDCER